MGAGLEFATFSQTWPGYCGLPRRQGKLKDITRFDAPFFGVTPKQATVMDPQMRILLEVVYEAILDAGRLITPSLPVSARLEPVDAARHSHGRVCRPEQQRVGDGRGAHVGRGEHHGVFAVWMHTVDVRQPSVSGTALVNSHLHQLVFVRSARSVAGRRHGLLVDGHGDAAGPGRHAPAAVRGGDRRRVPTEPHALFDFAVPAAGHAGQ